MKGYKGFSPGLVCRGKQYAENTVFEEKDAVKKGMHFCENPFDVLEYYPLVNDNAEINDFAKVEALAETRTKDHKNYCTTKLKVGAKLSFAGFVKACVDFVFEKTIKDMPSSKVSSGYCDQIGSSGDCDQIGSSGDCDQIGSSGYYARIGSSGDYARIGSSGYYAKIVSSGNYAKIVSSGNYAKIVSSGDYAQIGSSGYCDQIGSSGYYARIGSSGDYARIGSSGNCAQIGSSGYCDQIGSSGDYARINSTGEDSVICCAGMDSAVKAKVGSWITLAEWENNEEKARYVPVCVKTEFVDGERIKADVWYKLENGEFVEENLLA